jgi:glucose/arabinose dehydrogenase
MGISPDGRIFVTELEGRVRIIKNGQLQATPFLTVQTSNSAQGGLLGLTFDPDFESNGYLYVHYTSPNAWPHQHISRFQADPNNPDQVLPNSEEILLHINNEPQTGHLGGHIRFGLDGKLYIPIGDNFDPASAQNIEKTNGKILRVNPDGTVPSDNPFVHIPWAKQEIWAMGFRNPFSFAIQPGTGRIFMNDVGADPPERREEVNEIVKGGNYGWPSNQGYTSDSQFQSPLFAYDSTFAGGNCSITGGAFYNPEEEKFPTKYVGKYFFSDLCGGWIYYLDPDAPNPQSTVTAFSPDLSGGSPVDLTVSADGDLFYLDYFRGQVRRISFGATTTSLTSSLPSARVGSAVTFTATVTSGFTGIVNGDVTFFDRGTPLGTAALVNGTARFTTSSLAPGNHSIQAVYGGDSGGSQLEASTSNALTQIIRAGESMFAVGGAPGRVQLRHVQNGALMADFAPFGPGFYGKVEVALGDVNSDGHQDLIAGAGVGNPHIRVYDGAAFAAGTFDPINSLLAQWFAFGTGFNVGINVAISDVDNDAYADVVVGAASGNPHVRVFNGKDIAFNTVQATGPGLLAEFFAYGLQFNIGAHVAAGDVNGDGFADIVTGATAGNPNVRVYSGADIANGTFKPQGASRLASWFAYGLSFNIGANVGVGDVNGDGYLDVITGATAGNPHVRVFSGIDIANGAATPTGPGATVLDEFFAYQLKFNVGAAVASADFDSNGKADILTGAANGSPHFRAVAGSATGVLPPALNGIDALLGGAFGGATVAA